MTNALLDRQKTRGIPGSRVAKERVDGSIETWEPADFAEPRLDGRREIYGIPGSKVKGKLAGGVLDSWKPSDLVKPGVEGETFVQIEPTFDDGADSAPAKMTVKNLNLWYKDFHALKDINLEFPVNQVTALIGPSGCGKSTLLKTLNRMNDLVEGCRVEGEVTLDGQDTYRSIDVNDLRRRVGMVFQQPNPFPMSVYDNIAFGPRTHGIKNRKQLDEIVEQSLRDAAIWDELKDRLKKNALGLSGGQQQRLCIARALAVRPEVLLMDESTSALDPISTAKIEELVGQLKSKYTVIMVTHNMLQALRVSDRTAFFLLGEMVETGPTDDIFTNPHDKRTADYVAGRFG